MARDRIGSRELAIAIRFASWVLPPHRKDWAAAMLNEMAYARSRRSALLWALGCALSAIRERGVYEFMRTFTSRRIFKTLFGISALTVIAVAGVYATQKPYQRERILLYVLHGCGKFDCPRH